ncbi:MAG: sigma 54-interacting transcriptional regulator [Anaerolineae bacterium]
MDPLAGLLGESPGITAVRDRVWRLLARHPQARHLPPVLLHGETGTGKGLLARAIHAAGPRGAGPFLEVNCAAIPETLLEAELFGFERGAFTDARQAKPGLLQAAHGGTLFLDEIALLSGVLQGKLLTVIEQRAVRRLGSTRSEPVDVWIISATSQDLLRAVQTGRFREDLYHRLAVLTLQLPPLRECGRDILLLAKHFLARAGADYALPARTLAPDAQAALLGYPWPGNVRELANLMERVTLLSETPVVTAAMLDLPKPLPMTAPEPPRPEDPRSLDAAMRDLLLRALHDTNWNLAVAAARLGIARNTLKARMRKYGLRPGAPSLSSSRRARVPTEPPAPVPASASGVPATLPAEFERPPGIRWERRHLTLLRAALVPTRPEAAPLESSRALEVLVDKVQGFGGRVEELGATGLVAAFGVEPLEDAPRRVAHAAMAIQKVAERAQRVNAERPHVILGIHAAHVLVGEAGGTVSIELDAKRAAWSALDALVGRADPGTILVSDGAAPFLERRFELVGIGPLAHAEGQAYRLVGRERPGLALGGRLLSRFVGREREFELLQHRWASAGRGHGQVVGIIGEPGIGKSRLLFEFRQSLAREPLTYLEGACLAYASTTPYFAVLTLLKAHLKLEDSDDAPAIRAKVAAALAASETPSDKTVSPVLALLEALPEDDALRDLDPRQRRKRTLDAVKRILLGEAQRQPLVLVIEDLQWIDSETQAVLDSLVESVSGARLFLLVSYRPEYQHRWGQKTYYTQLPLDPLPPESAEELLQGLLGNAAELHPLKRLLIDGTEGNPFFLEESVRTLIETRVLVGEQGAYRPAKPVQHIDVPPTVEMVLAARMDRLPPEDKTLLQTAAVIGKDVPFALLRAIVELPGEALRGRVAHLQAGEFLYERSLVPELEYTFKHALTYEVAYESLPEARRRDLHTRIVEALERLYPERLVELAETLAHHALRGEAWEKAPTYSRQSGDKAVARSAYHEAVGFLEQALAALGRLPESRETLSQALDVRLTLGPALIVAKGPSAPAVEASYRAAQDLCGRLADTGRLFPVLWGLWYSTFHRAQYERACELGEQLLSLTARGDDSALRLEAHHSVWSTLFGLGRPAEAEAQCREGAVLYDPSLHRSSVLLYGGHDPGVCSRYIRALSVWQLGYPDRALQQIQDALTLANRLSHPLTTIIALYFAAWLHSLRGETESAEKKAETTVSLGRAHAVSLWPEYGSMLLGRLMIESGRQEEGLRHLNTARGPATAARRTWGAVFSSYLLAGAYLKLGQPENGLEVLRALVAPGIEGFYQAELERLRGELLLARTPPARDQAESHFRRAIDIAGRRGEKSFELRTVTSLSRLWASQGKRGDARQLLAPTYRWFSEGFGTADLNEAKALLDDLS